MKFKELYQKGLERKVNPAVSASDMNPDTVKTEIDEYVFTQEIIINLYTILSNIKTNQGSHVGIWINGYYGSGKSHFLKYVSYCLIQEHSMQAFNRLIDAVKEFNDKNKTGLSDLEVAGVSVPELLSLQKWYANHADVEMVLFNIGDVHNSNSNKEETFTTIFWNQFNERRGYNSFNLAMAQLLEKALDEDGKFQDFKEYVKSKGFDWKKNLPRFCAGSLSKALAMAKDVDPDLDIDVIREGIINNNVNVSVNAFANEINEYIESKNNKDFRLMFFVDEVSQFIGEHRDLLLQLQSLVKRLEEVCKSKAWIACTAQQTLDEVVTNVGGNTVNPEDEVGKILGRFEVRASLQGTSPEYITQRRILEKNGTAEMDLQKMYNINKSKLDAQFILPVSYITYRNKEEFANYYPFVPYQFQLIMKVLDSFVNMNYVNKEVKGNERSLINITYSIAKESAERNVGEFIPFDSFFGPMFRGSLQHLGQRALENARQAVEVLSKGKQSFYKRVVYVLFMISNMSESDKLTFGANVDNIAVLLMNKMDENKQSIKEKVIEVLDYLTDKSVIQKKEQTNAMPVYEFYTEDESQVAELIKNQQVDTDFILDQYKKIIEDHFAGASNKHNYATRSFAIGANADSKHFWANNADVEVDFAFGSQYASASEYAFHSLPNRLTFYLCDTMKADKELQKDFITYCRTQKYIINNKQNASSPERTKTNELFGKRAATIFHDKVEPKIKKMLDECTVIMGNSVLSSAETSNKKGIFRYEYLIDLHLSRYYTYAKLVDSNEIPRNQNELQAKIKRPIEPGSELKTMTDAEDKMLNYIKQYPHEPSVADLIHVFGKAPYGWSEFATIYIINELVRRHIISFSYNNNPDVSREEVAAHIIKESNKFTIEMAKAIPQQVINDFIAAWKHVFNTVDVKGSNDSSELYRKCKEDDSELSEKLSEIQNLKSNIAQCPFRDVANKAIDILEKWKAIKDHKKFFETVTNEQNDAASILDNCNKIIKFVDTQFDKYNDIIKFVDANNENFQMIANCKDAIDKIKKIKEEKEPWNCLPPYIKLKRELEKIINDKKNELIEKVKVVYNIVFDNLEKYATDKQVPLSAFANREQTINNKIATTSLHVLQSHIDSAKSFSEDQMKVITNVINTAGETKQGFKKQHTISIKPDYPITITSTNDVDKYLDSLRAKILAYLNDDQDVIIM
ncbi:MAG: BREX system P-loop protein BrxC [Bacteroidales bacterium]|nr:BREX system P-loop protein BrxC [Bacteroidales bacterium]